LEALEVVDGVDAGAVDARLRSWARLSGPTKAFSVPSAFTSHQHFHNLFQPGRESSGTSSVFQYIIRINISRPLIR
jgi:hypothetical protein